MRFHLLIAGLVAVSLQAKTIHPDRLVAAAKAQIGITLSYSDGYRAITYPNGDISPLTGCCTDVLIRAYRTFEVDLQKIVHEDIRSRMELYRHLLTKGRADRNIDHRRVAVLQKFFQLHGVVLPATTAADDYKPGDIVVWRLRNGRLHIGLVADHAAGRTPVVVHNIGYGVKAEQVLFEWKIIGHFRYLLPAA